VLALSCHDAKPTLQRVKTPTVPSRGDLSSDGSSRQAVTGYRELSPSTGRLSP